MEKEYNDLSRKIKMAYKSCSLKTVNAFNPYQFEKMLEVLFTEFSQKGIEKDRFDIVLKTSLEEIGAVYEKKI
jgi:hypothetical protein